MKRILIAAAAALCLSTPAMAQTAYIGQIQYFPYGSTTTSVGWCPSGWLHANGALVAIASYTVLYDVLGTNYGGNGTTDFRLPNVRPIVTTNSVKLTPCIAYLGVFPSQG